jgi:phosphoesterase RecJ-like protein
MQPLTISQTGSIETLLKLLRERESFVVTSHARPDGDAIGSALGLMHLLEGMGKQVTVAFADAIPGIYRWLPGVERIQSTLPAQAPDAAILLECDRVERTGFDPVDFERMGAELTINVDHHLSGRPFAEFNWIDPQASAVGAMVYDVAVASGVEITAAMATCLYTAVMTDTGSFSYPSTCAGTFAMVGHLVERGANPSAIAHAVYFSNPASKIRLLGAALSNMRIDRLKAGGEIAWSWITQEEMERAGADVEDCEGVVNYLIGIAGVEVAVFLREVPEGAQFRLSLRSQGSVDVATVAERFGGGGHRIASGCTLDGPLESAMARLMAELELS